MKLLVIGLDCAAPELLFGDERLTNIRRLMNAGCFGRLESVIPPITIPAWMCMATSQDPGSLGIYGFRNRKDYTYDGLSIVNSKSIQELAIWDQIAREGGRSIIVGVPPSYPPRKISGICVGCFLTPDPTKDVFAYPASVCEEITQLVGSYPVDAKGFRTHDKNWLKDEIYAMSRKQFEVVRHFLTTKDWDYFQFVEIGLDRMHHGFWKYHDPQHVLFDASNPYKHVIQDYYGYLDEQIGSILELIDDDTTILIASDHGAQRLDGGFCVNEWLVQEGYLVLHEYPTEITPFSQLHINWDETTVWSEGGYYARVFLNVKGREPNGVISPADYDHVRDEVKAKLENTVDHEGKPLGTQVFKPEEIYRVVKNIPPDLMVHFGGLYWRSIGGVGYRKLHIQENDTGPDDCNHAQFGAYILAGSSCPLPGCRDTSMLNIAPTLLELGGYEIPSSMQGKSLISELPLEVNGEGGFSTEEEAIVKERLSGLGYIS